MMSVRRVRIVGNKLWFWLLAIALLFLVVDDCLLFWWAPSLRLVLAQPWFLYGMWLVYQALRRRITTPVSDETAS
jgi:hypothetical protein